MFTINKKYLLPNLLLHKTKRYFDKIIIKVLNKKFVQVIYSYYITKYINLYVSVLYVIYTYFLQGVK